MSQSRTIQKENKMGTEPIGSLLIRMSIPMMCSMLVQAFYNVVDSIFVSRINEAALTAVSMAFPVQNLMIAVATGTGVGVNALLSRSLGEKNQERANDTANAAIFLAVMSCIVFTVLGAFGSHAFMAAQISRAEASREALLLYGTQYVRIVTTLSFGIFGQIAFEKIMQSTGRTVMTMLTQGIGAIINIILDPILIFGLFGAPRLEVVGAALATVTGQILGMFLGVYLCLRHNPEVTLSWRGILRPKKDVIGQIYAVGVPSILMASIGSVMTFCMNKILMGFTATATAVFGVYFKIQSFFFMPMFGLNNGMVPIVAYNYGARNRIRVLDAQKYAMRYAYGIMAVGLFVFEVFPDKVLALFNASENMLAIGMPALRIICTSYVFAAFCIVSSSFFQALGNSVYSLIISLVRQLGVLVPVAFLMSLTGNLLLVWLSYPIAELASVTLAAIFRRRIMREKLDF